MKKIIFFGLIFVLLITMTACEIKNSNIEPDIEPEKKGDFYSLQEAYDLELLSQDDLKSIAYYLNLERGMVDEDEDYVPMPKTPEVLSVETENAVKETRAYYLRNLYPDPIQDAKADGIKIFLYYGTYNDCVAVMMYDYFYYTTGGRNITIAGVIFHYGDGNEILIWKEAVSEDNSN